MINNVGIIEGGGIEDISLEAWKRVFQVNVHVPFLIIKKMLWLLKRAESACVINVSSIASKITGDCLAYSASKAALDMMTKIACQSNVKILYTSQFGQSGYFYDGISDP